MLFFANFITKAPLAVKDQTENKVTKTDDYVI